MYIHKKNSSECITQSNNMCSLRKCVTEHCVELFTLQVNAEEGCVLQCTAALEYNVCIEHNEAQRVCY